MLEQSQKLFVLDTNVLLHDPIALYNFPGAHIGIPIIVLEELEKFKKEPSDRGKNARDFIRMLDDLRHKGSLSKGVALENGTVVTILFMPDDAPLVIGLHKDMADNKIVLTAVALQHKGYNVTFISKDLNARIKADVLGLATEDYTKGIVPRDEFYKGWIRLAVPSIQLKQEVPQDLLEYEKKYDFMPNEYVLVESQHNPYNYRVYRYQGGPKPFILVEHPKMVWDLGAKNPQQLMALDALFDPKIELVTLVGTAGTGKTFLALLAGLEQIIMHDLYKKILVSRPVVPLGPDIGYLPGDLQEKLHSWMQPVYDNVDVILQASILSQHLENLQNEHVAPQQMESEGDRKYHKKKHLKKAKPHKYMLHSVEDLVQQHKLSLEAITYMRGRSIPYQYILIDEVQNLSPHEVKTIISRVGQGSKIILCGDPYQIDSPYLDFSSNGLVIASDKFKEQKICATVYLEHSERSQLSRLAAELM